MLICCSGGPAFEKLRVNTKQFVRPNEIPPPIDHPPQLEEHAQGPDGKALRTCLHIPRDASSNSSASTTTTSLTVPDVDSDWDNDSEDLSSDPELYDELREERIPNPKVYFERLASLEREVFENSGIHAYKNGTSNDNDDDHLFLQPPVVSLPLTGINSEAIISLIRFTKSEKLLHLWETYILAVRMCKNLTCLRDFGFCQSFISFLTKDQDRAGVAKIMQIEIQSISEFVRDIEGIVEAAVMEISQMQIVKATRWSVNRFIENLDQERRLTSRSLDLLLSMGLLPHLLLNDDPSIIWQCAFQTLDLVLLSYAGSHIQRFDRDLMDTEIEAFQIPRRFVYHDETLRGIASLSSCRSIIFRRRQLQCLDKLLGKKQP